MAGINRRAAVANPESSLTIAIVIMKGSEHLASDKIVMRLGGIYALEGVMNTSEQYHGPVLEAMCAFVRESTIGKTVPKDKPTTDVQAALTVIGRRIKGPGAVDLANVSIPGANLSHAALSDANLSGTDLSGANLSNADLTGARLTKADLSGANLFGANLSGTDLSGANLGNADLFGARLVKANLSNADLTGARLVKANLSGANLSGANLLGARGLTQTQLDEACGDANTKLPEGFTPLKPCS
jgi:Pentapeptide repeats (8 copies)